MRKNVILTQLILFSGCPSIVSFIEAFSASLFHHQRHQKKLNTRPSLTLFMSSYVDDGGDGYGDEGGTGTDANLKSPAPGNNSRRSVLRSALSSLFIIGTQNQQADALPGIPEQKSYSSNARNMDRLSVGDSSGGSVYDNDPVSASARKRRAMLGCKIESSRKEASGMANIQMLSEKDCNIRVMGGDTDFMLDALKKLDCPTCPYGIDGA